MKLLVIDGNSIVNRAFFGMHPLNNREGFPDVYKRQVLETALRRAGATILGEETAPSAPLLTKADLFACGLSGGAGSREKRQALLRKLGLPAHLSPNAMLPVLSALYDRQTLLEEMRKL